MQVGRKRWDRNTFRFQQRSPKYSRPVLGMRERRIGWKAHSDFTLFWTWSTVLFHSWFVHASRDSSRWTTDWNTSIRIQWRVAIGHTFNFRTFFDWDLGGNVFWDDSSWWNDDRKREKKKISLLCHCYRSSAVCSPFATTSPNQPLVSDFCWKNGIQGVSPNVMLSSTPQISDSRAHLGASDFDVFTFAVGVSNVPSLLASFARQGSRCNRSFHFTASYL